jgi:hypothetical protein
MCACCLVGACSAELWRCDVGAAKLRLNCGALSIGPSRYHIMNVLPQSSKLFLIVIFYSEDYSELFSTQNSFNSSRNLASSMLCS